MGRPGGGVDGHKPGEAAAAQRDRPIAGEAAVNSASFNPIKIWHYGPVTRTGAGAGIEVRRRDAGSTASFDTASDVTSQFIVSAGLAPESAAVDPSGRVVVLRPGAAFEAGFYEYRVRPTSTLRSVVDSTTTAAVASYDYFFRLGCGGGDGATNPADIVSIGGFPPPDGQLTVDDYTSFINAFASPDPLADIVSIGGFPPPDGQVTVDDYTSFVNSFAAGCS